MDKDPYVVLGVAPDASQRQIRKAFIALAERHRKEMLSDPGAYHEFEDTNAAYHLLADPAARRRYNEEHGLPPPAESNTGDSGGFWSVIDNALPDEWYLRIPLLLIPIVYFAS